MPATITSPKTRELATGPMPGSLTNNTVVLHEQKYLAPHGRVRVLRVTEYQPQGIHSLHSIDFKDCLSSMAWNLESGLVVVFHEHHDGGGRQYQIWGTGSDGDVHDNNFGDCASSWTWYRNG
jgi:hypothetical protein